MDYHIDNKKKVIALGFFDGVHLGHQALLRTTVQRARAWDMVPAVFTFDRSPRAFVTGATVPLLTTLEERRTAIKRLFPIDEVIVAPFDEKMMTMPWAEFVTMLAQTYHAGALVAGHNFRFGHRNAGNTELLVNKAQQLGMHCDIVPAVTLDGVPVSSTHIRTLLEQGQVAEAARFLGFPFSISGSILHGKGLGSRIGSPTVNLIPPAGQMLPAYGVYVTLVTVDDKTYRAITNVGTRPTVDAHGSVTIESHLLGENLQLYGKTCRVEFLQMLRPEQKFHSLPALQAQIAADIQAALDYFQT